MKKTRRAHEFVHAKSIGNLVLCEDIKKKTSNILYYGLYQKKKTAGHQVLLIKSKDDADKYFIMSDYEKLTNGKYPFIFTAVQPAKDVDFDIDGLMEKLDYVRIHAKNKIYLEPSNVDN